MAVIKTLYPSTSTVALAIELGGLGDDNTNGVFGRTSVAVDNTVNLDRDHLLSGKIVLGTSPVAGRVVEVWAYAPLSIAAGVPTYPDTITSADSSQTLTSANVKIAALRRVASLMTDAVTGRALFFAPVSIAGLFGGMPPFWGVFVVNRSGVMTGSGGLMHYQRLQAQTV